MKIILTDDERLQLPKGLEDIEFRISSWRLETRYQQHRTHDIEPIDKNVPILLQLDLQAVKSWGDLENDLC